MNQISAVPRLRAACSTQAGLRYPEDHSPFVAGRVEIRPKVCSSRTDGSSLVPSVCSTVARRGPAPTHPNDDLHLASGVHGRMHESESWVPSVDVPTTVPIEPIRFGMRGEGGTQNGPPRTTGSVGDALAVKIDSAVDPCVVVDEAEGCETAHAAAIRLATQTSANRSTHVSVCVRRRRR